MRTMGWLRTLSVMGAILAAAATSRSEPAGGTGAGGEVAVGSAMLAPNGGLLVDGKPLVPIFVWAQPSHTLAMHKELGFNTVHAGEREEKDPIRTFLDTAHSLGLRALIEHDRFSPAVANHPAILAVTVEHEADMAVPPPYEADVAEGTIWIEGESPAHSTFKPNPWLDKELPGLSGRRWLTSDKSGEGEAVYTFDVPKAGTYALWVREFNKAWANPTRWQLDDQPVQETPRTAKGKEVRDLGGGRAVGWVLYATVELSAGEHSLKLSIVPGRTNGGPNKPTTPDAFWAVDAIALTPGDSFPSPRTTAWQPRRPVSVQAENLKRVRAIDSDVLTWVIFTSAFYKTYNKVPLSFYEEASQHADVLSFDHYPVTGWNRPDRLPEVALATRQLVELARPGQPVWTIIEASDQQLSFTPPATRGPTPQEMRAEAWSSIAAGAKGIGYFTISFGRNKKFEWNLLPDDIRAELKRTNGEITELAGPIVLGETVELAVSGDETDDVAAEGRAIVATAKAYEGVTYVIAVNVTRQEVRPTFRVAGSSAGAAEVWKTDRRVSVTDGAFAETFEPLGVRVFVLPSR